MQADNSHCVNIIDQLGVTDRECRIHLVETQHKHLFNTYSSYTQGAHTHMHTRTHTYLSRRSGVRKLETSQSHFHQELGGQIIIIIGYGSGYNYVAIAVGGIENNYK